MTDGALIDDINALLGRDGAGISVAPSLFGGNNRVHLIEGADAPLVAKSYFRSITDKRPRLQAEWAFINYAYGTGLRCVPPPVAVDVEKQLALYERVEGRKLTAAEIGETEVNAAADFIRALNEPVRRRGASALPAASESGFSIAEHFAVNDGRMARLAQATADASGQVAAFVADLNATWRGLKTAVAARALAAGIGVDDVLPHEARWISPSDFGFHNVLKRPDGGLCFLDFEYAGWDDPAKLVADFFLQPQVPVDRRYFAAFVARAAGSPMLDVLRARVEILQPVFALKWCIIMMNPFVADRAQAGKFADPSRDEDERKRTQLAKAMTALQAVKQSDTNGIR